jgi:hypothetical protein
MNNENLPSADDKALSPRNLKAKWQQQEGPIKFLVIAAALVVGLLFVLKILPALVAAMGIGLLVALLVIPYWVPTIVAFVRKHPSRGAILALNLFLGWTFVGWVVSFVWAVSDNARGGHQTVVVNTTVLAGSAAPPSSQEQYRVGDVVNGHRFNGASWIPLQASSASPPPPPLEVAPALPAQPAPPRSSEL